MAAEDSDHIHHVVDSDDQWRYGDGGWPGDHEQTRIDDEDLVLLNGIGKCEW